MANTTTALKRWRQSIKNRDRNRSRRSATRTAVRRVREAAARGDAAELQERLPQAYSALDRAAKTGAMHVGKADRQKRRLALLARRSTGGGA